MTSNSNWRVYDIHEMLRRTRGAHKKLLETYERASRAGSSLDVNS